MDKRFLLHFAVISCLGLAASCSTNHNTIEDGADDTSTGDIWDQDLSDEIDALDGDDRGELFTLASKAFTCVVNFPPADRKKQVALRPPAYRL